MSLRRPKPPIKGGSAPEEEEAARHTIHIHTTSAILQVVLVSSYPIICYERATTYHCSERNSTRGVIINSYKVDKKGGATD